MICSEEFYSALILYFFISTESLSQWILQYQIKNQQVLIKRGTYNKFGKIHFSTFQIITHDVCIGWTKQLISFKLLDIIIYYSC